MTKTILVTGASGFVGKNLCVALRRRGTFEVLEFGRQNTPSDLDAMVERADIVFHLAGVNRPKDEAEFAMGNTDLTRRLCDCLARHGRRIPLALASSIQAELDNPYGRSKKAAEDAVREYQQKQHAPVYVFRYPNVFGKWCRPNYNSVVATFCHNIQRGLPTQVNNRSTPLRLVYVDDVVRGLLDIAERTEHQPENALGRLPPEYSTTLGQLHDLLTAFKQDRAKSLVPNLSDPFTKYLYTTFLSYCETDNFAYPVELKTDERGWLFELVKSAQSGQIFVSKTRPGITRGNHFHDTKIEKFCVIQGEGIIRFRHVLDDRIIEYPVSDRAIQIVDIPPGYTHSIENVSATEMITLFWANEIFDPGHPDTYFVNVKTPAITNPLPAGNSAARGGGRENQSREMSTPTKT